RVCADHAGATGCRSGGGFVGICHGLYRHGRILLASGAGERDSDLNVGCDSAEVQPVRDPTFFTWNPEDPALLSELRIRNFALIDELSVRLRPGLNVLTGETGAGKSIIVGALSLL